MVRSNWFSGCKLGPAHDSEPDSILRLRNAHAGASYELVTNAWGTERGIRHSSNIRPNPGDTGENRELGRKHGCPKPTGTTTTREKIGWDYSKSSVRCNSVSVL